MVRASESPKSGGLKDFEYCENMVKEWRVNVNLITIVAIFILIM